MAEADPDRPCPHPDFAVFADVARIVKSGEPETDDTPAMAYTASLRVECAACGERFRWIGVQAGDMPSRPMCGVDEFELRAPLRPATSDPDFGLGMPGFAIQFRGEPRAEVPYDRAVLADILVYHYRESIKGCSCGWSELGRSWPEHVATVYEETVKGRVR